jgi:predicted metal-dependent phosphoesterase TrpH
LTRPKRIFQEALRRKLDAIAITDHNSLRTFEVGSSNGFQTIAGCEYATGFGDIAGLFNKSYRPDKNVFKLIDHLKEEQALAVFVHPYRANRGGEKLVRDVADQCDLVEVWNGRSSIELNKKAMKLARALDKPVVAGSDAHSPKEIGSSQTVLDSFDPTQPLYRQLLRNPRHLSVSLASNYEKRVTSIVRSFREYRYAFTLKLVFVHCVKSLTEALVG